MKGPRIERAILWHHPAVEGRLVSVLADDGSLGWGEAAPLRGFSRDTLADVDRTFDRVIQQLQGLDLEQALLPSTGLGALSQLLSRRVPELGSCGAARHALEYAILSIVASSRGTTVADWLRGSPVASSLHSAALLDDLTDHDEAVARAQSATARGMRVLKVKVGRLPLREECAVIFAMKRACGDVTIRADANGGFRIERARDAVAALAEVGVDLIEEPVSGPPLLHLGPTAIPWAADESLQDPVFAQRVLDAPGCGAVVLKPGALGLLAAYALALDADRRGLATIVTHMRGGPLGLAAACELALALGNAPWGAGLDPLPALEVWRLPRPRHVEHAGRVVPAPTPRLSFDVARAGGWRPRPSEEGLA